MKQPDDQYRGVPCKNEVTVVLIRNRYFVLSWEMSEKVRKGLVFDYVRIKYLLS